MSLPTRAGLMEKPMNVEQIVKAAGEQLFDPQFSMQNWFRTAELMLKQASIYEHEGNDQMAYFLLYRHAHIVLDDLAKHPYAKDPEFKPAWSEARKSLKRTLAKLEVLKPRINKRYEKYEERRRATTVQDGQIAVHGNDQRRGSSLANTIRRMSSGSPDDSRTASPARIDPDQHRDMAVQLANREIQRRTGRDAQTRGGPGGGAQEHDGAADISSRLIEARRQSKFSRRDNVAAGHSTRPVDTAAYNYPHVPIKSAVSTTTILRADGRQLPPSSFPDVSSEPPQIPRKDFASPRGLNQLSNTPPPRPVKTTTNVSAYPSNFQPLSNHLPPPPPHQFAASSLLENGSALRTIFLPSPLRHHFVKIASPNTSACLETCGILCGTLIRNAFFITKLVIPEQTSTSDTCEMVNEAALYEYCDAQPEELMVLGWIHTHPTQTCFMSSRDLHTHVWYQLQMPESIAIVCSPSKSPDWGIFRLTDPPGMQAIRSCKQPGVFHPHAESHIFTDALGRPGHVIEHAELEFEVVDLRPKR